MASFAAIIFDLDGVLIDSSSAHEAAFRAIFARFPKVNWSYYDIAGMRTDEAIDLILSREKVSLTAEQKREMVAEKRRVASEILAKSVPIDPECRAILERLSRRYRLAIGTSANRKQLDFFLDQSQTRSLFPVALSGEAVAHSKPDPAIYRLCGEQLKTPPAQCLVIEDALTGIAAARGAGMQVVWFDRHAFTLPEKTPILARIERLAQLEGIL